MNPSILPTGEFSSVSVKRRGESREQNLESRDLNYFELISIK